MNQRWTQDSWALEVLQLAARVAQAGDLPAPEVSARLASTASTAELGGDWMLPHLDAVLLAPRVDRALQWLQEVRFWARAVPELEATVMSSPPGRLQLRA